MRRLTISVALLVPVLASSQRSSWREAFTQRLVSAAVARAQVHVRYTGAYVRIPYPDGDVPPDTGACTDEIVRIYRTQGIDLQRLVHEDMAQHLSEYPLHGHHTDANIDHRRVPNLMVFFSKYGERLENTPNGDFRPGDIVAWDLDGRHTHIGMVVDQRTMFGRYKVLHNIGEGPKIEDVLFDWKIIGHYRYYGPNSR